VATVNAKLGHIVTLTPSLSSSTATGEIDALIDEARTRIRSRTDSKLNFILSSCVSGAPEEILHDGKKEAHPTEMQVQLGHTDIRTTLDPDYRPGVARMVNQVTNCILGLGQEVEPGSVQ
jgi:hypothetical protein